MSSTSRFASNDREKFPDDAARSAALRRFGSSGATGFTSTFVVARMWQASTAAASWVAPPSGTGDGVGLAVAAGVGVGAACGLARVEQAARAATVAKGRA